MSTRIKICGITSRDDAIAVADAGADAIGLVFYDKSPRVVDLKLASDIVDVVSPFVTVVGLFVNASVEAVNNVLGSVPLHMLQFHGDEDLAYCQQFQRPFLKAIRVKPDDTAVSVEASISQYGGASGILLDTYSKTAAGGTGEAFNWESVPRDSSAAIVLAGGLQEGNIAAAITATRPDAVDVSSGVEMEPGIKDIDKVKRFIDQVHSVNY